MGNDLDTAGAAPVASVASRLVKDHGDRAFRDRPPPPVSPRPAEPDDSVADSAALMGDALDHVPSPARERLAAMMAETVRVRDQLDQAHRRLAWLERRLDDHPDVPLPNRHAFLRVLGQVQHLAERAGAAPGLLMVLALDGIETVRREQGAEAADAALAAAARLLEGGLRQTDLLAYRDGGLFLLCLAGGEGEGAEDKAARLRGLLQTMPFEWMGHTYRFPVSGAQAVLTTEENAAAALDAVLAAALAQGAVRR